MRRICLSFLLFSLAVSPSLMAQKPDDAARWIDGLKNTSVDELGSGLPHKTFEAWFADLVKPNKVVYGVEECHLNTAAEGVTEQLFCVAAYTKPPHAGWREWIQLSFIVGSKPPHDAAAKAPEANRPGYIFLRGIESTTNPQMARSDRVFSDLTDLEDIVRRSHPQFSARIKSPAPRVTRGAT